jgi:hypothetical protein
MEDDEIILKNDENEKELIIYLDDADLYELLEKIISIESGGGQFTWGYNRKSQEGKIIVSFKKIRLLANGKIVEDNTEYFPYKILLGLILGIALAGLGLYSLIFHIVNVCNH